MITDWDAAYANGARETDAPGIFADWGRRGAAFRATARGETDIAYGGHARERFDLFLPEGEPRGLIAFIHGGYWKAMDKDHSSWVAAGPTARGWAVAVPSYPLAPEARIGAIGRSVARAVEAAAARVAGPIVLTGHSAGGHLAARLVCDDGLLAEGVAARVARVVPISGVFDLRPLMRTAMNDILTIDEAEARAESPALLRPRAGLRLTAWVGGSELAEFRRQNALLANVWTGLGADCEAVETAGERHFGVVEPMAHPASALVSALTG